MVKIHWSIYLILGGAVLYTSNRIDSQKFKLFIWVGYLFLAFGVAKFVIWFISRKKETRAERREIRNYDYKNQRMPRQQSAAGFCQRCGNQLSGYENFCQNCGNRLR